MIDTLNKYSKSNEILDRVNDLMYGLGGNKSQYKDCFKNLNDYEFHFSEIYSAGVVHWLIIGLVNSSILLKKKRERDNSISQSLKNEN